MASVGNIMANKSIADLAVAITPPGAATGSNGFGEYMQQSMNNQQPVDAIADSSKVQPVAKDKIVSVQQDDSNITESDSMQNAVVQDPVSAVTKEQMESINQEIKDVIKTALGIDEDTIETVLAEMGIMPVELLQPENLQQFILLVDGGQEPTDFLMNEEMMNDFNLVFEVLQNVDMTEITDTPMTEILQQMTQLPEEMSLETFDMTDSLSQEVLLSQENDDATTVVEQKSPEVIVVQQEDQPANDAVTGEDSISVDEQSQVVTVENVSNQVSQDAGSQNRNMGDADASSQQEAELSEQTVSARPEPEPDFIAVGNHIQQQFTADVVSEIAAPQPTPQMVQIVEQIVEQIRIQVQSDTTTMEMQLNPESLGKVLLTISNRAGMMTANFTVQTEEARMAIENQMYTLRENLEQKELKVDAVEVTVSNFDFMQSGADGEDQKDLNQGDGRSRRFQMEEQEEDGEETSEAAEAERVRRNVMRDNGGSIDFIA